jgi:hypothetical protein
VATNFPHSLVSGLHTLAPVLQICDWIRDSSVYPVPHALGPEVILNSWGPEGIVGSGEEREIGRRRGSGRRGHIGGR